jgi:DNA-binding LytR/AlgR family response regulator
VTTGDNSGTSSGDGGTNCWRLARVPFGLIAIVSFVIAAINATSALLESKTGGVAIDARAAWFSEVSSVFMVVALSPAVSWVLWKAPPSSRLSAPDWAKVAGIHLAAACLFAVLHVIGMVAIRKFGYAAVGASYTFAYQDDVLLPFFYEWRKDLLAYAGIALGFWVWDASPAQRATELAGRAPAFPVGDTRIEIRDGARVTFLEPAQISWIEAAGNYVEIHAGGAMHMVRGTLAGFEERLAPHGFVRVHRSRLLNRARLQSLKPTPSGDLELMLDDGRVIAGSRRFRAAVER